MDLELSSWKKRLSWKMLPKTLKRTATDSDPLTDDEDVRETARANPPGWEAALFDVGRSGFPKTILFNGKLDIVVNERLTALVAARAWSHVDEEFGDHKIVATNQTVSKLIPKRFHIDALTVVAQENQRAGAKLEYMERLALGAINKTGFHSHFKFGIARNPAWRFKLYRAEGYHRMMCLACDMDPEIACMQEACLIRVFIRVPGIDNIASGGERPPAGHDDGPWFTYVVVKDVEPPPPPKASKKFASNVLSFGSEVLPDLV